MKEIDCRKCPWPTSCCQEGVSIDLEEAKKILSLGLSGEFFHLAKDKDFPSGYGAPLILKINRYCPD